MKIPNARSMVTGTPISLARIVSEDSQLSQPGKTVLDKSSKDS